MSATKDTKPTTFSLSLRGREIRIAARYRPGTPGSDLALFLHGWGCAKESFSAAFDDEHLADLSLCAIDFPGHGASAPLAQSHDLLCDYAIIVRRVVAQLDHRKVHLVGHSMGGAIGLLAAPELDLGAFISIEGNLVGGDCGMISRRIAEQPQDEFTDRGFATFVAPLRSSNRPDERAWGDWAAACDPAALHAAARSLVAWCDGGDLASIYRTLTAARYVYGERNGLPDHLEPVVDPDTAFAVADAGHFPMIDNPERLLLTIAAPITRGAWAADR